MANDTNIAITYSNVKTDMVFAYFVLCWHSRNNNAPCILCLIYTARWNKSITHGLVTISTTLPGHSGRLELHPPLVDAVLLQWVGSFAK